MVSPASEFYKANLAATLHFYIYNVSDGVAVTNQTAKCFFQFYDEKGSLVISQFLFPSDDSRSFYITINDINISKIGEYPYEVYCNSTAEAGHLSSSLSTSPEIPLSKDNIPLIYFLIIISYVIMFLAYRNDNRLFETMAAFMLMILGVYIIIYGINGINNWLVRGFGTITIAIGAFAALTANEFMDKFM